MSAAEKFFTKVANDVLQASEQLATRMEEGINAILTGNIDGSKSRSGDAVNGGGETGQDSGEFANSGNGDDFEIMDDEDFDDGSFSPLHNIAENVVGDIMNSQVGPQTPMEHFHAFRHAITWSEPFILSLVAFQICMLLICIRVSRRGCGVVPRIVVMALIAAIVRSAEHLNRHAARNWETIATQNYFDQRGIFTSIMLCAPLLFDCFVMLVLFLREASQLLVQVKTAEMKKKKMERSRREGGQTSKRNTKKEQ